MSRVDNCDDSVSNSQAELDEKIGSDEHKDKETVKENCEPQSNLLENQHQNGLNGDINDGDEKKDEGQDGEKDSDNKSVLLTVDLNIKSEKCDEEEEEKPPVDIHKEDITEDDNAVDIEMNTSIYENKDEVENDPNFAVICSFLEKFAEALEIKYSIRQLKLMFEDYSKVRPDLIDLHIKLLRKRRKYINKEKWEKALAKFCLEYSMDDSWELERCGYRNTKLSLRLRIFVRLLEAMFDYNQKFKADLNANSEAASLRLQSFGRDITGYAYWYQVDNDLNFRLYKEEPDEDGSWSLVSKDLSELNEYIEGLEKKSVEDIKVESSISNSDESNSNQALILLMKSNEELIKAKENQNEEEEEKEEEEVEDEENEELQVSEMKVKDEPPEEKVQVSETSVVTVEPTTINEVDMEEILQQKQEEKCENNVEDNKEEFEDLNANAQQTEVVPSNRENEIKLLYEDLIKQVEENDGEEDDEDDSSQPRSVSTSRRGRGRRRGRYRRVTSGRKTQSKSEEPLTKHSEEEKQQASDNEKAQVSNSEKPQASESEMSTKEPRGKGRKRRSELDKLKEDFADSLTAKRSSRRIQALQEKKLIEMQEEQKRIEKEMLEKKRKKEAAQAAKTAAALAASLVRDESESESSESDHKCRKRQKRRKKAESDDDYNKDSDDDEVQMENKKKKKRRRGKGKRKRGNNPWEDSEDSEDHNAIFEDDFDDILEEDDNEVLKFYNDNEDEFACEEIDPNAEPVIVRRARTVKRSKEDTGEYEELVENDDKPCGRCGKYDNPQWILLCDKCDSGYHTSCLRPPMFIIPTGDWYCPPCEHVYLIEKLRLESKRLGEEIERREEEKLQQRKRWKFAHCEISAENILNEDAATQEGEVEGEVVAPKKSTSRKRKRKQNGFVKDEIEEAIEEYEGSGDDRSSGDLSGGSEDESSASDSSESSRSSDDLEDEIGEAAFGEERPRGKKRKERHVDVNDYSRSGLKLRAARKRKPISYIFKEYDDMIKSAILQEEDEVPYEEEDPSGAVQPRSKGKDISNILRANAELPDFSVNPFDDKKEPEVNDVVDTEESSTAVAQNAPPVDELQQFADEEGEEAEEEMVVKKSNKKQKKKLTNLDFSTEEEEDHASDDDFRLADDDEDIDEEVTEVEDNEEDDTINESDEDFVATRRRSSRSNARHSRRSSRKSKKKKKKKKSRKRSRGRGRGFIVESDEEVSTEDDNGSYNSDSSSDYEPRSRRRAAATKRVSYREDSSTEEEPAKNADDDDYFDEEDEDDGYIQKAKVTKSARQSKPPLKWTYSKDSSKKKRIIEDDDEDEVVSKPSKKCKTEDESSVSDDLVSEGLKEPEKSAATLKPIQEPSAIIAKADDKVVEHSQPSLSSTQSAPSISDSPLPPTYSVPPVDPLSSMKEMNSKLDYLSPSAPVSSNSATMVKLTSVNQPPPGPYSGGAPGLPPPPGLHPYQSPYPPPYRAAPPCSTAGYPPPPGPPPPHPSHYPLPPQQPYPPMMGHRGPPPPGSYVHPPPPHSAHYMPPHSPIRHGMPHNPNYPMVGPYVAPGPQPRPHYPPPTSGPTPGGDKTDDDYTLTNLDSCKPNRSPATPSTSTAPTSFPPPPHGYSPVPPVSGAGTSPPRILNLDSGSNYRAPGPPSYHYPGGYENSVRPPPPNYPPHYPPPPHAPHHHPGAPPGSPGYYAQGGVPPPPAPHPYGMQYGPAYPQSSPNVAPPLPHYPHMQRTPPSSQHSPSASPVYSQASSVNSTQGGPMPPRSQAISSIPPHSGSYPSPTGVPPASAFAYPYPPTSAPGQPPYQPGPNGDFTIQNLLHTQPSEPVCAVKSTPKASKDTPKASKSKAKTESSASKGKSTKSKKTKSQSVLPSDAGAAT